MGWQSRADGSYFPDCVSETNSQNKDIDTDYSFSQIADPDRKISTLYDMLDALDPTNRDAKGLPFTVRSLDAPILMSDYSRKQQNVKYALVLQVRTVFVIDPKKVIRLTISYPASTGRNFDEIIRVIDSLQLGDKHRITTPVNWQKGDDVIVHPTVSNEQAKTLFPEFTIHKVNLTPCV